MQRCASCLFEAPGQSLSHARQAEVPELATSCGFIEILQSVIDYGSDGLVVVDESFVRAWAACCLSQTRQVLVAEQAVRARLGGREHAFTGMQAGEPEHALNQTQSADAAFLKGGLRPFTNGDPRARIARAGWREDPLRGVSALRVPGRGRELSRTKPRV